MSGGDSVVRHDRRRGCNNSVLLQKAEQEARARARSLDDDDDPDWRPWHLGVKDVCRTQTVKQA